MREIVYLQTGLCGNQIGLRFWETIAEEHGINESTGRFEGTSDLQLQRTDVCFNETYTGRFVPRAVLVDLDPSMRDTVLSGTSSRSFFRPDNVIVGDGGGSNNYAKGYCTEGRALSGSVLESIRREVEATDCLQGVAALHALGGGTGSGLTALLLEQLREEYTDRIIATFSVYPSPKLSETVVEPYNAVLASNHLVETADEVMVLDNEALYDICFRTLHLAHPSYGDLNQLVANVMAGVTGSLRFPGQLNSDLRKLAVNMIPFPRLHFFLLGLSPLTAKSIQPFTRPTAISQLVYPLFHGRSHLMCGVDPTHGRYMTCALQIRGRVSTRELDETVQALRTKSSEAFVEWIPHHIMSSFCDIPPPKTPVAVSLVGNFTGIRFMFSRVLKQFQAMFSKKAYLHWYTAEGLEELDFSEAQSNLLDLAAEYEQYDHPNHEDDEWDDNTFY